MLLCEPSLACCAMRGQARQACMRQVTRKAGVLLSSCPQRLHEAIDHQELLSLGSIIVIIALIVAVAAVLAELSLRQHRKISKGSAHAIKHPPVDRSHAGQLRPCCARSRRQSICI